MRSYEAEYSFSRDEMLRVMSGELSIEERMAEQRERYRVYDKEKAEAASVRRQVRDENTAKLKVPQARKFSPLHKWQWLDTETNTMRWAKGRHGSSTGYKDPYVVALIERVDSGLASSRDVTYLAALVRRMSSSQVVHFVPDRFRPPLLRHPGGTARAEWLHMLRNYDPETYKSPYT